MRPALLRTLLVAAIVSLCGGVLRAGPITLRDCPGGLADGLGFSPVLGGGGMSEDYKPKLQKEAPGYVGASAQRDFTRIHRDRGAAPSSDLDGAWTGEPAAEVENYAVPEPGFSLSLFIVGLAGLMAFRRRPA